MPSQTSRALQSRRYISKSRYMSGRQCPRRLWQEVHHRERADDYSAGTEFTFSLGHQVGDLARQWRGKGVLIELERGNLPKALEDTQAALAAGKKRIFEAAFAWQDFLALADVIEQKRDGTWRLLEVKATTDVKEIHIPDLAFQAWLMEKNGLTVSEIGVVHLNNEAVWPQDELLVLDIVTQRVRDALPAVAKEARQQAKLIKTTTEPDIAPGSHCNSPYACNFQSHCWKDLPQDHLLYSTLRLQPKHRQFLEQHGWSRISHIRDTSALTAPQQRWISTIQSGKPYIDKAGIKNWLAQLTKPVYSLDFETIAYAIPVWSGTRPYQQIPFQFSCHKLGPRGKLEHAEYLHTNQKDPRPALADALIQAVGDSGSILAWNAAFERRVIEALAEHLPRKRKALLAIAARLLDPMQIFRQWYLHPACYGSASIKDVGKAVLGEQASYDSLAISSGDQAYVHWHQLVFENGNPAIIDDLKAYCRQDTLLPLQLLKVAQDAAGQ